MSNKTKLFEQITQAFTLISGPCVIEPGDVVFRLAENLKKLAEKLQINLVFKASFDKANRTSVDAYRGPGLEKGLLILEKIAQQFELPVLTDVHETWQIEPVSQVVDIIQIPAFLCRQTDLLIKAGQSDCIVNVKKGQFLTGQDMRHAINKIEHTGNKKIMLTERGNSYGNNNLVVDFRNVVDMISLGYPVVMDMTHAVQKPGGQGDKSGGSPQYASFLGKAAAAIGVKTFFIETHFNPLEALSDGPNMIALDQLPPVLQSILTISKHV